VKPQDEGEPSHVRRLLASRGAWGLVLCLALGVALFFWLRAAGGPDALRARWGWATAAILIAGQAVSGIWPLPASEMIALANSVLYGFWLGALFNWIGWMIASLLQYALLRDAVRALDLERALATFPAWLRRFPVGHPAFQILGRLVPLPAAPQMVSCASVACGVSLWRYSWCAAIGVAPGAMFFSGVANGLLSP